MPTRIAYARENQHKKLRVDTWGCAVRPDMVSCSWTKLLLDINAIGREHDDPYLQYAIDEGVLHIPQGRDFSKTPQEVCADFLSKVYLHMLEKITDQIGEQFLTSTPMDCWLTVPAVWSDKAQEMTLEAAKTAGFGSRAGDNIFIIPEPEAAAIATFKTRTKPHAPNPPEVGYSHLSEENNGRTYNQNNRQARISSYAMQVAAQWTYPHTRLSLQARR